jgi:PIN domain nuclease of toxin-antitoxin system
MGRGLERDLSIAYLDTQVAIWLHAGALENLTGEANRQIESNDLLISPMAFLEFQYLLERKRIGKDPLAIYTYLQVRFGVNLCSFPFAAIATEALSCTWTRDPFDRIIVSHAKVNGEAVLITADRKIRQNYSGARW